MLSRRLASEALGSALLVAAVVGSGVMAERLAGGSAGLALLCNSIATGAALVVIIALLAPVSGAHLNPLVSLAMAIRGDLARSALAPYVAAQCLGAVGGTMLAHVMFGLPLLAAGDHARTGVPLWTGEAVATFCLLLVVLGSARRQPAAVPWLVGLTITAAYWFTSSTSFANPAVTLARSLTPTFTGIRPADVPAFILAETAGAGLALAAARLLFGAEVAGRRQPAP